MRNKASLLFRSALLRVSHCRTPLFPTQLNMRVDYVVMLEKVLAEIVNATSKTRWKTRLLEQPDK
jgi:hypothetical protein